MREHEPTFVSLPRMPPPLPASGPRAFGPIEANERIVTLDLLRGFALFGILMVNMAMFSWPASRVIVEGGMWDSRWDVIADWVVRFLAEGKFYPLFSFLFGYGFVIQMQRAAERGVSLSETYTRRLLVLLGFGMAHAVLLWEGDILVVYAIFGFLLLPFQACRPRTLLIWAAVCLLIPLLCFIALWTLILVASLVPAFSDSMEQSFSAMDDKYEANMAASLEVFARGNWFEIMVQRMRNWALLWESGWFYIPTFVAMFLIGAYAGRRRFLHEPGLNRPFLRRVVVLGLLVGVPASAVYTVGYGIANISSADPLWIPILAGAAVSAPALSLAYAAAVTLFSLEPSRKRWLAPVAAAGRMPLTNYLFQSLIATTIFYSYGLGLYGSVGRASGLGIALVIYAVQLPLSVWWLKRHPLGPAEWLWRRLTYGGRRENSQ